MSIIDFAGVSRLLPSSLTFGRARTSSPLGVFGGLRRLCALIGSNQKQCESKSTPRSSQARDSERNNTAAMATIRPMRPDDLLNFSSTNLDHLTETYNIGFYLEYLTKWPELCQVIEGLDGQIEGYSASRTPPLSRATANAPQSSASSSPRRTSPPSSPTSRSKQRSSSPTTSPGTATSRL